MVWLDGENTIPASGAGVERGSHSPAGGIDAGLRACLLFGDLSAGRVSGCGVVDKWAEEERKVPFHLFASQECIALWRAGIVRHRPDSRNRLVCRPLLAPYSSYGRIASNLFAPIYGWGNNALAYLAERADSYAFYETSVWLKSLPTFIVAALTFIIISVLAWRNGRTYCNTVCPVGTVLGFLSRFSLLRVTIDKEKCNACGLCSRKCKAACIDGKNHTVDYSRCVACMDCIDTCRHGAISFGLRRKKETVAKQPVNAGQIDDARRSFLTATAIVATAATVKAQEKKVDGGLAVIEDKKIPERATPIVPPGAWSARDFARHCTACQLCVSVCPNEVLRPSTDLMKLMQPEMSYERGYCRPECTKCGDVCPAGAIRPITVAEKSATQIGHAVWVKENCVPLTDGVECGNCARHCPTGAIQMVPSDPSDAESPKIPVVNTERCIGCGACENLCPARPFSAIYVEGHEVHRVV